MNFWQQTWKLLSFMGVQYILGRRGAYPYGLLIKLSLIEITFLVILCDALQSVALLTLLERIPWLSRLLEKARTRRREKKRWAWLQRLDSHRFMAMLIIAAIPYGGGALSGSLFALSTSSPRFKSFLFILTGCFLGTMLYHALFSSFS